MRRARLVPRLAAAAVARAKAISVLLYLVGVGMPLFFPLMVRNTYISENALMPGMATTHTFTGRFALKVASQVEHMHRSGNASAVAEAMRGIGLEVYTQHFTPNAALGGAALGTIGCENVFGVLRSPLGDGREGLVIATPLATSSQAGVDATGLGVGIELLDRLVGVGWLARDVVLLVPDAGSGACGPSRGVEAWLDGYYHGGAAEGGGVHFGRVGMIAAGLVLEMTREAYDEIRVLPEAADGQLPNLDLFNIAVLIGQRYQRIPMTIDGKKDLLDLSRYGLDLGWEAKGYLQTLGTIGQFMWRAACGGAAAPHAPFKRHKVDAITLRAVPAAKLNGKYHGGFGTAKAAQLLEGTVRCCNNLLEKFHQSFFQYVLASPNHFISIDVYMIPLGLLLATLPLLSAALTLYGPTASPPRTGTARARGRRAWWRRGRGAGGAGGEAGDAGGENEGAGVGRGEGEGGETKDGVGAAAGAGEGRVSGTAATEEPAPPLPAFVDDRDFLRAMFAVAAVHFWGVAVGCAPIAIAWAGVRDPRAWLAAWAAAAAVMWAVVDKCIAHWGGESTSARTGGGWVELKVCTACAAGVLLAGLAGVNWSLAYLAAAVLAPACLLTRPLRSPVAGSAAPIAATALASPPALAIAAAAAAAGGAGGAAAAATSVWWWVEQSVQQGTSAYPLVFAIYLPICVLCWRVALFKPPAGPKSE